MTNYQNLFDGIVFLLEKNSEANELAQQCLADCSLELAFTPAQTGNTIAKKTLLDIYKHTDEEAVKQLNKSFSESEIKEVHIWYLDTENGSYTIFTDKDCKKLVGLKSSSRTLQDIRKNYFNQKDLLEKIGEAPAFNYAQNEITFINRKLVE